MTRSDGLHKRCACARRKWPKCAHPWHLGFCHKRQQYRLSLDKHLSRHLQTRTEAETEAEKIRIAIRNGTFGTSTPTTDPAEETVETYARQWLRTAAQNLKTSTVRFYTDHLDNHVFPAIGHRPIRAVARPDCRNLITTARDKGLKVTTVAGIARTLSTVLTQAVEDELLPANPALRLGKYLRRADEEMAEPDPFTADEAAHLVEIAREHFPAWHAYVLSGLRTGLRPGELLALQWGDVDWRGRYVEVRRNLVRGKLTTPKNHQCRRVDLSLELRRVLRLWRREKTRQWFKLGFPRPDWIFPSSAGTALDEANVRKAWKAILTKAELHHRGAHQMRHSYASLLLQAGEPITYVSAQLGHRDPSITLRVYAHYLPDAGARKGVDRLDSAETFTHSSHATSRSALGRSA